MEGHLGSGPERYHAYVAGTKSSPELAGKIVQLLSKKSNLYVFQDMKAEQTMKNVDRGIMKSRRIILPMTRTQQEDGLVHREVQRAIAKAESLYPGVILVILDVDMQRNDLPENLRAYNYLQYSVEEDFENRLDRNVLEDITPKELIPKTGMGAAFAYAIYQGYLRIILPGITQRIRECGIGNNEIDPQKRNLCPTFLIIVPETCYGAPSLSDIDPSIKFYTHVPYNVSRGGQQNRCYKSTVYKIEDASRSEGQEYLFMGEIPQILINLYEMSKGNWFGFGEDKLTIEMPQFYYYLKRLVDGSKDCKDQVSFIYHSDAGSRGVQPLGELIKEQVAHDILELAKREINLKGAQNSNAEPMDTDTAAGDEAQVARPTLRPEEAPHLRDSQVHLYLPSYPMKKTRKGEAIIVNNVKFTESENLNLSERFGAYNDEETTKTFLEAMGFVVHVRRDLSVAEIMQWFAVFSAPERHLDADAFVFVLMSHGQLGKIFGRDGDLVNIVDIASMVAGCTSLRGKPKIGFVQACQVVNHKGSGDAEEKDKFVSPELCKKLEDIKIDSNSPTPWTDEGVLKASLVPSHPDFFMSYAALPGMKAYRHLDTGSFYINALKESLARAGSMELDRVCKMVTQQVKKEMDRIFPESIMKPLQLPFHLSTGDKLLYLK